MGATVTISVQQSTSFQDVTDEFDVAATTAEITSTTGHTSTIICDSNAIYFEPSMHDLAECDSDIQSCQESIDTSNIAMDNGSFGFYVIVLQFVVLLACKLL